MQAEYSAGLLDHIRRQFGNAVLKEKFEETAQKNRGNAVDLLNARGLSFGTFYLLLPQIDKLNLYPQLSPRNRAAASFCARVGPDLKLGMPGQPDDGQAEHEALNWMIRGGLREESLGNEFEHILDISASVLTRTYHETGLTHELVKLLFRRNRKGATIHELAWALFGSHDPRILLWISDYLKSGHKKDAELARILLRHSGASPGHSSYRAWFHENRPYLYFTGEGFHRTCSPVPCGVDLNAKYLCKEISPWGRKPLEPCTQEEQQRLEAFELLNDGDRDVLATYSHHLRALSKKRWKSWMRYPLDRQLETARGALRPPLKK